MNYKKLIWALCVFFPCTVFGKVFSDSMLASQASKNFAIAKKSPLTLHSFLYTMPKGADLHNHIVGAVYAETLIQEAADENMCVNLTTYVVSAAQKTKGLNFCPKDSFVASEATGAAQSNINLYNGMLHAFSMLDFVPGQESGHDHFFAVFEKILIFRNHYAAWANEVVSRAAAQNEQYMELMLDAKCDTCQDLAEKIANQSADDLMKSDSLLKRWDFKNDIEIAQKFLKNIEKDRNNIEKCGTQQAMPACNMKVRYINQIYRGLPKAQVFARMAFTFKLLEAETKNPNALWVGLNLVMPEDGMYSMNDYTEQMKVLGFLKSQSQEPEKIHISLHAGELVPGLVPPNGLKSHIREAITLGKAERIGHGVDVMYEDDPETLLKMMAEKHVLVEINLTSNEVILGVSGEQHPLPIYRKYGVPMVLSTDDEGISRIDLTHEFQRATTTYSLNYADLKEMVRNSLEYSFLPGQSLWQQRGYRDIKKVCANNLPEATMLSSGCEAFLKSNEKAAQQWELEKRFHYFEQTLSN